MKRGKTFLRRYERGPDVSYGLGGGVYRGVVLDFSRPGKPTDTRLLFPRAFEHSGALAIER
jgi:hypothetical protein